MSGPSSRPARRGSGSPSWPTGSRAPTTPLASRRSVTGSAPPHPDLLPALAGPPAAAADRCRPAGGLLVGAVHAPGRGVPHPGAGPAPPGAGVLCGAGGRQPGHRPARRGLADLRPARIRSDTETGFATRVVTRGVDVTVNCFYKHSRIKQYLKEGRALRIETVINSPTD